MLSRLPECAGSGCPGRPVTLSWLAEQSLPMAKTGQEVPRCAYPGCENEPRPGRQGAEPGYCGVPDPVTGERHTALSACRRRQVLALRRGRVVRVPDRARRPLRARQGAGLHHRRSRRRPHRGAIPVRGPDRDRRPAPRRRPSTTRSSARSGPGWSSPCTGTTFTEPASGDLVPLSGRSRPSSTACWPGSGRTASASGSRRDTRA
jgi:hypothetical protein